MNSWLDENQDASMPENPFQSPTSDPVPLSGGAGTPQANVTSALWRGFLIAPAIVPVSFVIALLSLSLVLIYFGVEINPASLLVLPVVAMTAGLVASYAIALLVGLPIVLYLRRRHRLTCLTLHVAACLVSVLFSLVFSLVAFHNSWVELSASVGLVFAAVAPPTLLSTTVFWVVIRRSL